MRIRPMTVADLADVARLFESLHWPYTRRDIDRLFALQPDGWFAAEEGGTYVGQAMGLLLGSGQGAVGLVAVEESRRERGTGTRLTQAALDFLLSRGATQVRLDATEMGVEIYERMGFSRICDVYHFSRDLPSSPGGEPAPATSSAPPLGELAEFDARTYGVGRAEVLAALARDSEVFASYRDGKLAGYCMTRATSEPRGGWIGPLVAVDEAAGRALLEQAVERLAGRVARLGVPAPNEKACGALEELGFSCDFVLTRMYYGDQTSRESLQAVWAEAGHEKG